MRKTSSKPKPKSRAPRTEAQKAVQFKKGVVGKPRGPNKITRDLKEGIIDAAVAIGIDGKGTEGLLGYLKMCAKKHPKQYIGLLSRVMPLQISGDIGGFIGQVNIVSVPVDRYLSADDVKKLNPPDDVVDAEFTEASSKESVS